MAYVPQIPEDEQNKFANKGQTTPYPVPTGGGAPTSGAGAPPGQATSTQFGSNASKLSDYLKANQDQVKAFGNQVAGNLNTGYNSILDSMNQGFGNFNQQVNQGYAQPNQKLVDQAASNPSEFVKNQGNVDAFKSLYNNQYTGPNNFESSQPYANINDQVNQAVQNTGMLNTQSGLTSYLNNYLGGANKTQGMQNLDTLLLQRSPEARQAISNAAAPYKGLTNMLANKMQEADTNVANAKKSAQDNAASVQNQFIGQGGVIPSFQNDLNQRVSSAQQTAADRIKAVQDLLNNPTYDASSDSTKQALSDLGLTQGQYEQFRGLNFPNTSTTTPQVNYNGYVTFQNPQAMLNAGNVASADDYARAAALQQLTGQDMSGFLNPMNSNLAGIGNLDLTDTDVLGLLKYLNIDQSVSGGGDAFTPTEPGTPSFPSQPIIPPIDRTVGTPIPGVIGTPENNTKSTQGSPPGGTVGSGGGQYTYVDENGNLRTVA